MNETKCKISYPHDFPDYPCQKCNPEREKRKANYISYVLSKYRGGGDEEQIIKEASEKFENENI